MFKRGFTIVELMVVVAIIGILTGIGVVAANQVQKDARDNKRKSDVAAMESMLEKFYDQHGVYPGGCHTSCDSWFVYENAAGGYDLIKPSATVAQIQSKLPDLPKSINDPNNPTADTPFNVRGGYFYYAGVNNRPPTEPTGYRTDYTPEPVIDSGAGKQCYYRLALDAGQAGSYVLAYYSEVEERWITKLGRHGVKPTLATGSHSSCSL